MKPNLMQCVSKDYPTSFVITDPKGSLIGEVGQLLQRSGYRVKVLNTINFSKSMRYNPFRYIHSEKDILKLVNHADLQYQGRGRKERGRFLDKVGTAAVFGPDRLYLVRSAGRGNELHDAA